MAPERYGLGDEIASAVVRDLHIPLADVFKRWE
jgi:hypothetical protein